MTGRRGRGGEVERGAARVEVERGVATVEVGGADSLILASPAASPPAITLAPGVDRGRHRGQALHTRVARVDSNNNEE
jgi:hypothetical protein